MGASVPFLPAFPRTPGGSLPCPTTGSCCLPIGSGFAVKVREASAIGGSLMSDLGRGARVLPVLAALLAAGCAKEPTGDVSGRVVYNDRLLPSGSVAFYDEKGRVESSLISSDG